MMGNRVEVLRKYIDEIILNMTDVEEKKMCLYAFIWSITILCINCFKT